MKCESFSLCLRMFVLASAECQMFDEESSLLQFGGDGLFFEAFLRGSSSLSLLRHFKSSKNVCVCYRDSLRSRGGILWSATGRVPVHPQMNAMEAPLVRRECRPRYKFPPAIATRQRFSLGRPCLAETFLPNWRQNSGESSTLLYPPTRECEDVKVSSQTRLFGRRFGNCKAVFTIPVPLLAGERDFLRGETDNNAGISPGDGIYANRSPHTSHTRQTSAINP